MRPMISCYVDDEVVVKPKTEKYPLWAWQWNIDVKKVIAKKNNTHQYNKYQKRSSEATEIDVTP